jgi:hypothetical protein
VISVEEFRAYADEHLDWARTARTDREREIFLQMARAWLQVAAEADGRILTEPLSPGSVSDHQALKINSEESP